MGATLQVVRVAGSRVRERWGAPGVLALGLLVALCFGGVAEGARARRAARFAATKGAPVPEKPDAVADELLVRFKPGRALATMNALEAAGGIRVVRSRSLRRTHWHRIQVAPGRSVKEVVEAYRGAADVVFAEPNYRLRAFPAQTVPDDPDFGDLWGLHNTGQTGGTADADIDAPEAWERITASNVLVAVIDSGVDYTHPDLAANVWTHPGEIAGNGVDDDGNGYVDDVRGWDFVDHDSDPRDEDGHGTHCAGTVGAVGNNATGVVGVCWSVKIMALRFIGESGTGATSDAIEAIEYATAMGAKVLSCSWGTTDYSQALSDAIADAHDAGVLLVAAAGNDYGVDNDTRPQYPASYDHPNVIAVAATTNRDGLAGFSNFGATSVDLGAPGQTIYSTVPNGGYASKSGTSMATPHVAGACALVWAAAGALTHTETKAAILNGVDLISALQGKCLSNGRLNLRHALDIATAGRRLAVVSPNGAESTEGGVSIEITWTTAGDGWLADDTVALEYSDDAGLSWSPIAGAEALPYDAGAFAWDTTGLPPGEQYRIRIAFTNDPVVSDASDGNFALTGPFHHLDVAIATPQPNGRAVMGTCTIEAKDADGRTITSFAVARTAGRFPVTLSAPAVTITGLSGGGGDLGPDDFIDGVADLTALGMTLAVDSPPVTVQFTAASADGKTGTSDHVVIHDPVDYLTEQFDTTPFDLDRRSIVFIPNGSPNHYAAYTCTITTLPTDPTGGTPLDLDDDDTTAVALPPGKSVSLYGTSYTTLHVNSDGNITFTTGDAVRRRTLRRHFRYARLSALFDDLYPPRGQVSWKALDDRVAVTFVGVPEFDTTNSNTFQAELFYDGRLVLSYLGIASPDGIVGLSRGTGLPADFSESDLSAYPPLPADAPGALAVDTNPFIDGQLNRTGPAPGSLTLVGLDPNGNLTTTLYAIRLGTDGPWLAIVNNGQGGADSRDDAFAAATEPEWHTAAEWAALRLRGLGPATTYTLHAKASNAPGSGSALVEVGTFATNHAGDVNRSGAPTALDYAYIKAIILKGSSTPAAPWWPCDVDDDAEVTATDLAEARFWILNP